jgi:hypothetical protein
MFIRLHARKLLCGIEVIDADSHPTLKMTIKGEVKQVSLQVNGSSYANFL